MAKSLIDLGTTDVEENETVETVEVFKLDGKVYSLPKDVSAGVSLKYLQLQTEEGPDAAAYYIMREMLGQEAFDALANHPRLKKADLNKIMSVVEEHALADEEGK
jgi:hypothetical protein